MFPQAQILWVGDNLKFFRVPWSSALSLTAWTPPSWVTSGFCCHAHNGKELNAFQVCSCRTRDNSTPCNLAPSLSQPKLHWTLVYGKWYLPIYQDNRIFIVVIHQPQSLPIVYWLILYSDTLVRSALHLNLHSTFVGHSWLCRYFLIFSFGAPFKSYSFSEAWVATLNESEPLHTSTTPSEAPHVLPYHSA